MRLLHTALATVLAGSGNAATSSRFRGVFLIETTGTHTGLDNLGLESTLGCTPAPRFDFASGHFHGGSFQLECTGNGEVVVTAEVVLAQLSTVASVTRVWHLGQKIQPPSPATPGLRHRAALPGRDSTTVARRASSVASEPRKLQDDPEPFAPHVATGVDRLHAAGLLGSGIRIALIDGGFDLSVPGLANTRVVYTHDYIDGDADVSDGCSFHGTHILGTLGASSEKDNFGVVGVAPNATYELYRIAACGESSDVDVLIAASLDAADRGVDIISCSYGSRLEYPEDPWSVVLRRIEANGTFVVSITGNDGPGIFTVIAPASGGTISSAGSSDSPVTPYYSWRANVTDGSELRFVPSSPFVFPGSKLTVWYPGSAEELDDSVCQPLPAGTVHPEDPANTILLIDFDHCWADPDDGVTPITDKLGIPYVMFYQPKKYSTVEYGVTFVYDIKNTTGTFTGVVTISNADAQILSDKISQGVGVQVIIPTTPAESDMQIVYQPNEISGNQASRFSSWGPSLDGKLLPSVLAPGGNILSTFPSFLGNWGVVSGSSQATPLIAGVAALLLEKYPSLTPMELQALMSASAKPVKWNNEFAETLDYLAPVLQQGAGLLDAWAAANLTSRVNTSSLSFNDTANRPAHLAFSLSNVGSEAVTYTLANTGAASGYLLNSTSKYNLTGPEARPVYAELDISPASITLEPGAAADVLVSVKAGPQLPDAATRGSFFGGYVSISSASDGELLSVPYTGFGTALKSLPMINRDTTYPAIVNETFLEKVEDGRVFNCLYNASITVGSPVRCPDGVYPGFQLNLVLPTRRYIFDIVRAGNTTAVALKNAFSGGPLDVWTRNRFWYWDGTDGERAFLPAGKYVWRVTALRLYGDEETPDDFDVWYGNSWTLQFSADSILP